VIIIVRKVVLLARGFKKTVVPANSFAERFERVIFVPTPSSEFFIGPVVYLTIGLTVTGSKFCAKRRMHFL